MSDSQNDIPILQSDVTATISERMSQLTAAADVKRVYGEPVRENGITVIPAAEVLTVMGFGLGGGSGEDSSKLGKSSRGRGGGGGGGGQALARASAIVTISSAGVRVEPVVDKTKIALAAITAIGFMAATWLGFVRPGRMIRKLEDS